MDGLELKDLAEMVSKIQAGVMFDIFENTYLISGRELNERISSTFIFVCLIHSYSQQQLSLEAVLLVWLCLIVRNIHPLAPLKLTN